MFVHACAARRSILLVSALLLALLASASQAQAFKVRGHFYAANRAIELILAGHDAVELRDGRRIAVDPRLAEAIRHYPDHYRGGVGGADFLPDLAMAQGEVHPRSAPWLGHVYQRGWQAYQACGGCAAGEQALAFAYGFLTHAAGDVWSHTFVNRYAEGVFPSVPDVFGDAAKRRVAVRHVVVEGYIDRHTPNTATSMDAPLDFVRSTFMGRPPAGAGHGMLIDFFKGLQQRLEQERGALSAYTSARAAERAAKRRDLTTQDTVRRCTWLGCATVPDPADAPLNPVEAARLTAEIAAISAELAWQDTKSAYLDAWRADVARGLHDYPADHLAIGKALFASGGAGEPDVDLEEAERRARAWVLRPDGGMLSMLGVPDFVGATAGGILGFTDWVERLLTEAAKPLTAAKDRLVDHVLKSTVGMTQAELEEYVTAPERVINSPFDPVALPPDTSARIDAAMGLGVDGVAHPTYKFDPAAFAAMNNTIELAKLVLLDQRGLEHLTGRPYPQPNVMLGWPKSMDGEFQWLWLSPRDGSSAYGTGAFPLWRDCAARRDVFHALFSWWGDDGSLPSGWTRDRGFPVPPGEACAA